MFVFDTKTKNLSDPSTINQPTNNLESIKPETREKKQKNPETSWNSIKVQNLERSESKKIKKKLYSPPIKEKPRW
jgi:hypothetical protein